MPWPEVVLSARTFGFEVHTVHVPNSRNGWIKVETLEGLIAGLREREGILCGDFNTPRSERKDGTVLTFAHDKHGKLRPERGERWLAAELGILTGFWPDAFRALHPYSENDPKEISWNWPRFPRSGYRLDHAFTTYAVDRCEYVHEVRKTKLSDHSALEVDVSG